MTDHNTLDDIDAPLEMIADSSDQDALTNFDPGDEAIRATYRPNSETWEVTSRGTVDRVMDSITTAVYFEDGGQLGFASGATDEERLYRVAR